LRRCGLRPGSPEPPGRAPALTVVCFMFEHGSRSALPIKYIFDNQSDVQEHF
jgi:hypothetical protein